MSAHAKLAAALKRRPDDDDTLPPPLPPSQGPADRDVLKLRKSNLLGTSTWEVLPEKLAFNGKNDFAELHATVGKMFNNVLANPSEPKYRKIRGSNLNFQAKVFSCKGAPELFALVGFKDRVEDGFLILPEAADLALLQRGLDTLAAHANERSESEEKKRKLELERAAKAREERAQKAREAANPAAYDAAVAGAQGAMVDEDEAMLEAVEEWVGAHPEVISGRHIDTFEIERQVVGPGGTVIASVVASQGTTYFDYVAHMKRSDAGVWSVQKVEAA